MEDKLKIGDFVECAHFENKPKMKIKKIIGDNDAICFWFDKNHTYQEASFSIEYLVLES